ncbi:hypothetical protein BaRGS_00029817 [Batillaria attramentaria]|uniref:USP domain-containing protein n=1 Tax=Batillaria attramentaria TaxID=370345 RepID=A0ABD0JWB7_9CAEN
MFGSLFDEDGGGSVVQTVSGPEAPPRPRHQCGLAGIDNQGATCYLNSLLQTLLYTPEFRESLFQLTNDALGRIEDKEKQGAKVRIIPLQLQRLFLKLLLSNRQSVSTAELTESFGWTNNEEFQQHDVQELNRILFSAIEDSLVGTPGQDLIRQLYHGSIVNQIKCLKCGRISEREEDFLDLTVTVAGSLGLECALHSYYCDVEKMDGRNQYRCDNCASLVDATKGAKLRSLPQILTVSLLRFSFDFVKMTRYKESGKFTFPTDLDMSPYTEKPMKKEDTQYELYSVVVHRGSAYGGHYHAYIRDVDNLGTWNNPESAEVRVPSDPTKGKSDFIDCESPVDLVHVILSKHPDRAMSVDKLCSEMYKQTGVSWTKRYKKHYGAINRFLKKYDDKFFYNPDVNWVSLRDETTTSASSSADVSQQDKEVPGPSSEPSGTGAENTSGNCEQDQDGKSGVTETAENPCGSTSDIPADGQRWFHFNDSHVGPVHSKELEKQYSGKESAYMLFYRRKSMKRPAAASGNAAYGIPDHMVTEILQENGVLDQLRADYDQEVNEVMVQLHFHWNYRFANGALTSIHGVAQFMDLAIDQRKSLHDLFIAISELGGDMTGVEFRLHRMRELPAGFHLYDELTDRDQSLRNLSVDSGTMLFVWDGHQVQGTTVPTGVEFEPVVLNIVHGNPSHTTTRVGFPKNMTVSDFRAKVSNITGIGEGRLVLRRIVGEDITTKVVSLEGGSGDGETDKLVTGGLTLENLQVKDGDQIVAEDGEGSGLKLPLALQEEAENWPVMQVEADKDMTVKELKAKAIAKFCLTDIGNSGRLREEHSSFGLRPPYHEDLSVADAGITKQTLLILEPGKPPASNEMTLTFSPGDPKGDIPDQEVVVDRNISVDACMQCMIKQAGLTGLDWHLRSTNFFGEAGDVLDDGEASLEQSLVNDGDHLLLERGRLPPKGFLHLSVWLYPPPRGPPQSSSVGSTLSWITSSLSAMFSGATSDSTKPGESVTELFLGEIDISKDATLEDLRLQILTLPGAKDLPVLMPDFMRVRVVEGGQLRQVLRGSQNTLRRMKVTSHSHLAVQIFPHDANISTNQVVLNIQLRDCSTRSYKEAHELVWDTVGGSSAHCLQQAVADLLALPVDGISIAKHFPQRFEWTLLRDNVQQKTNRPKKGKKKGNAPKSNIRQAPYHIQDGDVIGVKILAQDPQNQDDFTTVDDDNGKRRLLEEAEEKKRVREERKKLVESMGEPGSRRPEVALKIKVDKFT